MQEDRPDFGAVIGEAEPLPVLPAVRAPVGAAPGAEIDDVGVCRVDRDRLDLAEVGQAALERRPAVVALRAPEDPAERLRARPRGADVDVRKRRWMGHGVFPRGRKPEEPTQPVSETSSMTPSGPLYFTSTLAWR